jgi:hypothetical protein
MVKEQGLEAFLRPVIALRVNYRYVLEGVRSVSDQLPDLLLLKKPPEWVLSWTVFSL